MGYPCDLGLFLESMEKLAGRGGDGQGSLGNALNIYSSNLNCLDVQYCRSLDTQLDQ